MAQSAEVFALGLGVYLPLARLFVYSLTYSSNVCSVLACARPWGYASEESKDAAFVELAFSRRGRSTRTSACVAVDADNCVYEITKCGMLDTRGVQRAGGCCYFIWGDQERK